MPRKHVVATGCVLAITVIALAAVPAGADRREGPSAAREALPVSPVKPPPGMLEAIQRDLDLTRAQAQERLLNEARLVPLARQLARRLGARFGGAWLRGKTGSILVMASTDAADIPTLVAAGAQAEVVTRSLADLSAIKDRLDATLPQQQLVSSVRYIGVKRNKVIVLSTEPVKTQNFVQSAGVDEEAVITLLSAEAPNPLYDLVGGTAYYIGVVSRCSIGFSVFKGDQEGFISAGHCGKTGSTTAGFNRVDQGVFRGSAFPGSDYAWVAVNRNWKSVPGVDNGEGGTVPVSGAQVSIEGASVCRSGSTTDWHCGLLQQLDASVTYPQGTVSNLTRTSVCAEPGDSGGPFISIDQAQGITSGGSGDCSSGGTTYFQPIVPILTAYGLSLATTVGNPPPPATGTCTGYTSTHTGSLSKGQSAYQPRSVYYRSNVAGVHSGCLDAEAGVDFDLHLQKLNGSTWQVVATSDAAGSDEKISYTGTPGYYRYQVVSKVGAGPYTLGFNAP